MDPDRLVRSVVELTDVLADDFDIVEYGRRLTRHCVDLVGVDAVGVLLVDDLAVLGLLASSDDTVGRLELSQLDTQEGPCLDAFRTGARISHTDLSAAGGRWPRFASAATEVGITAVDSLPLRLRDKVIGALNLFRSARGPLPASTLIDAQSLADVATVALIRERELRQYRVLSEQLQNALTGRVTVEQAKGFVAGRAGVAIEVALAALRGYARRNNRKLTEVAEGVVTGRVRVGDLLTELDRPPH